jgi:hypothetical protein
MTAGSARTTLPNLHKLERLLNTEMDCFYKRTDNRYSMSTSATFEFLFDFNINQPVKLRDLRIHMLPFVFATSKTKGCHPVIFQLVTSVSGQQRYTTTLGVLRQRVLDALTSWKLPAKDATRVCPDIWADGHGHVREMVGGRDTVQKAVHDGADMADELDPENKADDEHDDFNGNKATDSEHTKVGLPCSSNRCLESTIRQLVSMIYVDSESKPYEAFGRHPRLAFVTPFRRR